MNDHNMADEREDYHESILDSISISINEPGDREQSKVYYYVKRTTDCVFESSNTSRD